VLAGAYGFLGDAAAHDQKVDLARAVSQVAVGIGFLGGGSS
jgi:uncharacterized membrane protein YhiD involved in acid resistance